ncbi:MAG: universal stress protein [Hyphomicrobiales bacterium]|nr:universal stress protein [Hyphomicrobiales bacterium]
MMPYKDLLLFLGDDQCCEQRTSAAIALAKRHNARVKGVALALNWPIPSYVGVEIPVDFSAARQEIAVKSADEAVATFTKVAESEDIEFDCEIITCDVSKAPAQLAFYARHADMSFLSQPDPDDDDFGYYESLLDGVLFASGRPVYAVPYIGRPEMKIRKAVIAWDGGKKAARAVNDAIPLLKDRDEVIVLIVNPEQRINAHGQNPGMNLVEHLQRHGINCSVEIETVANLSAAAVILNFISDSGADLLVMGAYGHSRLREWAFGGVTESIMHQMTVPVIMSE